MHSYALPGETEEDVKIQTGAECDTEMPEESLGMCCGASEACLLKGITKTHRLPTEKYTKICPSVLLSEHSCLHTGAQIGMENGNRVNINQLNGDQLKTVKDKSVKIEISVSDEQEGNVTMPTTVAKTDVTKPLIINTKFSTSPGPSSESTDTASEVLSDWSFWSL